MTLMPALFIGHGSPMNTLERNGDDSGRRPGGANEYLGNGASDGARTRDLRRDRPAL